MVRFFLLVIGELWLLVGGISGWRRRVLGSRGGRGRKTDDCWAQLGNWVQDNGGEAGGGSVERGGRGAWGRLKNRAEGVYFFYMDFLRADVLKTIGHAKEMTWETAQSVWRGVCCDNVGGCCC